MGLIIPHNDPISRSGPVLKVLGRMGLWGWGGAQFHPIQGPRGARWLRDASARGGARQSENRHEADPGAGIFRGGR